ncbi:restriction endonuclease subunit S [Sphingobium sp. PNB]|uniref:restriction endonuclease subunit S n=1 Tax=Sphingobium sp. PNB TaxID=863934 RepID=UPI001CA434C3|nr:restriction endonuclease subunit S [Sphingobium sp. PNB]MCB4859136.1 restriction endonuclease subunit S [Sphingobium sp. PNB]
MINGQATPYIRIENLADKRKWSLNGGPFGSKLVSSMYADEGVPVIRGANMGDGSRFHDADFVFVTTEKADELRAHTARRGDVIFTQRGTLGQVALIPPTSRFDRYVISQSQMKLTVDPLKADAAFIYYCFCEPKIRSDFVGLASSSGVPHVNLATLREYSIPLPPLDEQRRIADILSAYDDLIENNTRRIAILEDMARRLFEEWFVQRRAPVALSGPGDWIAATMGDALTLQRGFDLPISERTKGPYPVVAASGIHGFHREYKVRGPGVTTGRSGTIGQVQYIEGNFWPLNTSLWIKEFKHGGPVFAYYLLSSLDLTGNNTGAAVPSLNRNIVHSMPTILPPLRMVSAFEAIAGDMRRTISALTDANINLRTSRDLLLPKLISGEIEVRAAEEALEAAAA